jgi:hypothetical protein
LDKKPVSFGTFSPKQKLPMFNAQMIASWAQASHETNVAKGFCNVPASSRKLQGLIASEMFEAFEAVRRNKWAKPFAVQACQQYLRTHNMALEGSQNQYGCMYTGLHTFVGMETKDTVEAELASVCVRCVSTIGYWLAQGGGHIKDNETRLDLRSISEYAALKIDTALELAASIDDTSVPKDAPERGEMLVDYLLDMVHCALGIQTGGEQLGIITPLASVVDTLKNMALLAAWFNIDLVAHIKLELAYNRTRPERHGKEW